MHYYLSISIWCINKIALDRCVRCLATLASAKQQQRPIWCVLQFMVLYQLADQVSVNMMYLLDNSNYNNDQVSIDTGGVLLSGCLALLLAWRYPISVTA